MKKIVFVNEDVFLDFFVPADENKFRKAKSFFEKVVEGKVKAFTTAPVLIKIAEEMEKEFNWKKKEVAHNLELILSTPNLKINYRDLIRNAINVYQKKKVSFLTAYHVEVMKRMQSDVYASNEKEFLRFNNLKKWSDGK